jgi:glutaconate CoA-transferase subunit A
VEKKIPHEMELMEYSNYGSCLRLLAGVINVPFLPCRSFLGSDIMTYNEEHPGDGRSLFRGEGYD